MILKTSLLIFTMIFLISCKEETKENNSQIIDLVNTWNNSHNNDDLASLSNVYAKNVLYYGSNLEKSEIVDDKKKLFNKYPDFKQVFSEENLEITKTENGKLVSFTKNVTFNSNQKDYPSYLVVSEINGKWKIIKESDSITDNNVSKKSENGKIETAEKPVSKQTENNKLYGDFNGDGKKEYAWIEGPEMLNRDNYADWDEEYDSRGSYCIGGCNSVVYFSDKSIVPLTINQSYGGRLENLGDLNNDGSDNIGIWTNPSYVNGGSSLLVIYDAKNPFKPIVDPIYVRIIIHDLADLDVVKKLDGNKLEIKESVFDDKQGWLLKTKIVQLE